MTDKKFAKDVAKELDRRQRRRKLVVLGGGATAIVLAVMYLRCGHGWGLGGDGTGSGPGGGSGAESISSKRCELRVAKAGITLAGHAATRDEAIAACKPLGAADVVVTGDAREGDWDDLRKALEAAKIDIALRRPR